MRAFKAWCRPFAAIALFLLPLAAGAATPSITAGAVHSHALHADGTLRAWGSDAWGKLGVNRAIVRETAAPLARPPQKIVSLAASLHHVLALTEEGDVWSWGDNESGQLGDGSRANRPMPGRVPGLPRIRAVSAGNSHSVAMGIDGSVWAWGGLPSGIPGNFFGELGTHPGADKALPARVAGLPAIKAITAGRGVTFAVAEDGRLWAWGNNDYGMLGDGTTTSRAAPGVVAGIEGAVAVGAGHMHTLALTADGDVWAWGTNDHGALGDGTYGNRRLQPARVAGIGSVSAIAAAYYHSLALKRDGTVWAWGSNASGLLGDGTFTPRFTPRQTTRLTDVVAISTSFLHSVALRSDGTVFSWGANFGCPQGNCLATASPIPGPNGMQDASGVAAGAMYTLAVDRAGNLTGVGLNVAGQLGGDDDALARSTPARIETLAAVAAVSAGDNHSIALMANGSVFAWGSNLYGQRGEVGTPLPAQDPRQSGALFSMTDMTAISAGGIHNLALRADGVVWAWGGNFHFQLGVEGTTRAEPMPLDGLPDVAAISAGRTHSVALKRDGSVWAWGSNAFGELGESATQVARAVPAPVAGLTSVASIAAGWSTTAAIDSEGNAWMWGRNDWGQLGDGTFVSRSSPARVGGVPRLKAISAGHSHTVALAADGTMWAWGGNFSGELGDGGAANRALPAPVPGVGDVIAIDAGGGYTLALRSDGTVLAWGENHVGQLGDGTLAHRRRAVATLREGGAGRLEVDDWYLDLDPRVNGTIASPQAPHFAVVTKSQRDGIQADIRFRPEDAGRSGSVFVFALAPQDQVKHSAAKNGERFPPRSGEKTDGLVACVLAQLTASGELVAVTAAQLQAYVSGVLGAQAQAVNIINGVPIANIGGATFFVGYGTSAGSMFDAGTNRSVATIPGARQCQPQAPKTGWWWNPAEDGRGFSIEVQGNRIFFAAFLYDVSGRATWHVATGPTSLDGSLFQGDLLSARGGQTLGGAYPGFPALRSEGPVTLAFSDAERGTLVWPGGAVPIQRFDIVPGGTAVAPTASAAVRNGWWWNEQEAGRGFFLEWQGGVLDMAGYMYDEEGQPVWYLSVGAMTAPGSSTYQGNWWRYGHGQTLMGQWRPHTRISDNVAPVTVTFSGPDTAIMTLPDGRTTALKRHRF